VRAGRLRERILSDHEHLRGLLDELDQQVGRAASRAGDGVERLRALGLRLLAQFGEHLALEDRLLAPALRCAGAAGREQAERLDADHCEQRELLDYLLDKVRDPTRPGAVLAAEWRSFAELLRDDMAREELAILEKKQWEGLLSVKPSSPNSLGSRSVGH
jgi:hypothetical protein